MSPRRVYTIAALALTLAAQGVGPAAAQIELSASPAMTRGPVHAPVTIVEFSDYQ